MDWVNLPYDHSGRWKKEFDSVMNPGTKITWPQLIAETICYFRSKIFKFPEHNIQRGPGWYRTIQQRVRNLNQQAATICRYFPHPDDDAKIKEAVLVFLYKTRPLGLGGYRKHRVKNSNNRQVSIITKQEKDIVIGIQETYDKLKNQSSKLNDTIVNTEKPTFRKTSGKSRIDTIRHG